MTGWVFLFISLSIPLILGDCSCQYTSSDLSLYCTGDSEEYLGDTSLFVGNWTLCTTTLFMGSLEVVSFNISQLLLIPDQGSLTIEGDLVIPEITTLNTTVQITQVPFSTNATLEVFGDLIVKGYLNISVFNVLVHGSVIVQPTGQLWIAGVNYCYIHNNFTINGNCSLQGTPTTSNPITIGNSIISSTAVEEIYFSFYTVNVNGNIWLPQSSLTIASITYTDISALSANTTKILLQMLDVDKGQSNLNKPWYPLKLSTNLNAPVIFTMEWSCGSYSITPLINTTKGISIIMTGSNLTLNNGSYCCFESIDPCTCASLNHQPIPAACIIPCTDWVCDKTGFVVGWIIGGILIVAVMSVSCVLFCRDFLSI